MESIRGAFAHSLRSSSLLADRQIYKTGADIGRLTVPHAYAAPSFPSTEEFHASFKIL